jgi:hypothetical protein
MTVHVDGSIRTMHFRSQDWSTIEVDEDNNRVHVPNNNSMLIKKNPYEGENYAFTPYLRGGSIEFTVDLSTVECGCVAGVYAVKLDSQNCTENSLTTEHPQCQSIDVMQANPYGFNTSAHPCNNGTCDAASQCDYDMRDQGKEKYGEDAYGPRGTLIDTDQPFHVKTEFLSD